MSISTSTPSSSYDSANLHETALTASHPNPSVEVTADHQLRQVEAPIHVSGVGEALIHSKCTGGCGCVPTNGP
ncbi:hypothetical protein P154DRAFT_151065 [Amniculicola lignicola CBS 123094]|uniref:Uncharacterized protein n=1 Tax=Amniculicola lignicola CBS 123094 TaxID=1392246 RepID=A0A6A5WMU5_9PLEO|nr:hypothetical protein P154DRAFT_151065 [Amniculicola lignicola CBS 123094]